MIEAVSTLSVQSAALRANPQSSSSFAAVKEVSAPNMGFLSIRMDDRINKAILEFRSSEGEVIKQYPSESQIRAFIRSSELVENKPSKSDKQPAPAESASAPSFEFADAAPTPTPTHVDIVPANNPNSGGSASAGSSTQSVLV